MKQFQAVARRVPERRRRRVPRRASDLIPPLILRRRVPLRPDCSNTLSGMLQLQRIPEYEGQALNGISQQFFAFPPGECTGTCVTLWT
jgi:hypothetical protein